MKKTFTSKLLKFCLCDNKGKPVMIAQTYDLCLGSYAEHIKQLILDEESRKRIWRNMVKHKWTIHRASIECTVGDRITELPKK